MSYWEARDVGGRRGGRALPQPKAISPGRSGWPEPLSCRLTPLCRCAPPHRETSVYKHPST